MKFFSHFFFSTKIIKNLDLQQTTNTTTYKQVCEKAFEQYGSEFVLNQSWMDSVDKKCAGIQEKLDADLTTFKTQLARDSIRV